MACFEICGVEHLDSVTTVLVHIFICFMSIYVKTNSLHSHSERDRNNELKEGNPYLKKYFLVKCEQ
jgi:hypothetical protein